MHTPHTSHIHYYIEWPEFLCKNILINFKSFYFAFFSSLLWPLHVHWASALQQKCIKGKKWFCNKLLVLVHWIMSRKHVCEQALFHFFIFQQQFSFKLTHACTVQQTSKRSWPFQFFQLKFIGFDIFVRLCSSNYLVQLGVNEKKEDLWNCKAKR